VLQDSGDLNVKIHALQIALFAIKQLEPVLLVLLAFMDPQLVHLALGIVLPELFAIQLLGTAYLVYQVSMALNANQLALQIVPLVIKQLAIALLVLQDSMDLQPVLLALQMELV